MGSQPAASTLDFLLAYQFGAPVARAPARAGARATRSVGILSPDFFLVYPVVAPVAWASAHAGGGLPCPQVGGPAAAGPRTFYLCGHGEGGGSAAVEGLPEGVRSLGNPSVARARAGAARPAIAGSAGSARSKGPRPKGGVDPEAALAVVGSRAVGCADHARASGRDAPPYALLHFGADFSMLCRKHALCQGALGFPMAHSSLFWWAIGGPRGPHTPGTVVALRGAWPTGRGPCVTRGPHIPTALLAPSGRSTRPLHTV